MQPKIIKSSINQTAPNITFSQKSSWRYNPTMAFKYYSTACQYFKISVYWLYSSYFFRILSFITSFLILLCMVDSKTSSNHRANIQQMHSKYTCMMCALIARCLLDTCSTFAWYLLDVCLMFASCRLCFMHASWFLDVCSTFAICLLDVCFIIAWSCKRGIKHNHGIQHYRQGTNQCLWIHSWAQTVTDKPHQLIQLQLIYTDLSKRQQVKN